MKHCRCRTQSAGAFTTLMALCCVGGLCSVFADEPDEHDDANGPVWTLKVPWYETAKAKDRITVKSKLSALLKQDWENQKSDAEKAEQKIEAAGKLCSTDPRIP